MLLFSLLKVNKPLKINKLLGSLLPVHENPKIETVQVNAQHVLMANGILTLTMPNTNHNPNPK